MRSDHASLQWLQNFKEPEGQIARWLQVIGEYKFNIQHRPGKQHGNADGLSRQPCKQCGRIDDETPDQLSTNNEPAVCVIALLPEWDSQQLSKWQQEDTEITPIVDALREDKKPVISEVTAWPAVTKKYVNDWERLKLIDNVLYKEWSEPAGNNRWLLVHVSYVLKCYRLHMTAHWPDILVRDVRIYECVNNTTGLECQPIVASGARRARHVVVNICHHHVYITP